MKNASIGIKLQFAFLLTSMVALSNFSSSAHAATFEFDIYYGLGAPDFSLHIAPLAVSVYPWKNFGFSTGIEFANRTKSSSEKNITKVMAIIDSDGDEFDFTYTMDKYRDELSAQILHVPIMLKYRDKWFYSAAGLKIGIPRNVKVNMSYEGFNTEAYLEYLDAHFANLPHMGFGEHEDDSFETKISAKTLFMLAFESGVRIDIGKNLALLFGAFVDYSLNKGFSRSLKESVEWEEYTGGARVNVNDGWRDWKPWSAGGVAKLQFWFNTEM